MQTAARDAFDGNVKDIDRLIEIHKELTGDGPGRRYGVEVLNKSALVLITAAWEAYVEDLVGLSLAHLIADGTPGKLPKRLKKQIAVELQKDPNELAVWDLAEDGWRSVLKARLARLAKKRNFDWNTPKSGKIDAFVDESLGLQRVTDGWTWQGMGAPQARRKLDGYVALRGDIAHRGASDRPVKKGQVTGYLNHVGKLVEVTDLWMSNAMCTVTGKVLF